MGCYIRHVLFTFGQLRGVRLHHFQRWPSRMLVEHRERDGGEGEGKPTPQIVLMHGTGWCRASILEIAQAVSSQGLTICSIWACSDQEED